MRINKILNSKSCLKDSLRIGIFVIGAVLMIIGLAIVLTVQPKVDVMVVMMGGYGGLAPMMPEYQALQREIIMGQIMMVIGVIIMIPAIILKKKEKDEK